MRSPEVISSKRMFHINTIMLSMAGDLQLFVLTNDY